MKRILMPLLFAASAAAALLPWRAPLWAAPAVGGDPPAATDPSPEAAPEATITVTARRWQEPLQAVPESVTAFPEGTLRAAGLETVSEVAHRVPNLTLPDFSVRWLSFPYVRGIGSGRNSPAVTTIIDGVPQLSYITANQELQDVHRVEFIRGPQSSLYGRNTLAGVINVVPSLPSDTLAARARASFGDYGLWGARAGVSGPLGDGGFRGSLSLGTAARDGFTTNEITGNKLDSRDADFGFAQILWDDEGPWNARLSVTAENDRDGDYGLGDLAALRANPRRVAHDFEGHNRRELEQPVLTLSRRGHAADFTSITAYQGWRTNDRTDADFSPLDLLRRGTTESQRAWTQELRFSSPAGAATADGRVPYRWLIGAFAYTSRNTSDNFTQFQEAAAAAQGVPVAFAQHDTGRIRSTGVDPYGQVGLTLHERLHLTLGLRHDYERKTANLLSYFDPQIAPPTPVDARSTFNQTSPQASAAYQLSPDAMGYATVSKGYKAGGFNPQAAAATTTFGEETSWNYEVGLKSAWLRRRLVANLSLFHTTWDSIQLDVPTSIPAVFYIDNAGEATSQGGELELSFRPAAGVEVWGGVGILGTEFGSGSSSAGANVSGNRLPFAPPITLSAGAQYTGTLFQHYRGSARVDVRNTGRYYYDATNAQAQPGFTLVNVRLGVERGGWRIEGWVNNLFDEDYIPVGFPVPITPSGYLGESGAPRTVGVTLGWALP